MRVYHYKKVPKQPLDLSKVEYLQRDLTVLKEPTWGRRLQIIIIDEHFIISINNAFNYLSYKMVVHKTDCIYLFGILAKR